MINIFHTRHFLTPYTYHRGRIFRDNEKHLLQVWCAFVQRTRTYNYFFCIPSGCFWKSKNSVFSDSPCIVLYKIPYWHGLSYKIVLAHMDMLLSVASDLATPRRKSFFKDPCKIAVAVAHHQRTSGSPLNRPNSAHHQNDLKIQLSTL